MTRGTGGSRETKTHAAWCSGRVCYCEVASLALGLTCSPDLSSLLK